MIEYTGYIKKIRFYSESSNYIVALIDVEQEDKLITMNGYMNNFNTGQVVFRPIAGNVPSIALLMAWKKGEMKPALRDFIAIVQERLASVTA